MALEDAAEDAAEGVPEDVPEGVPEGTPEGVPEDANISLSVFSHMDADLVEDTLEFIVKDITELGVKGYIIINLDIIISFF